MTKPDGPEYVGVQDPEYNSPIADENDEFEYDVHENVSGLSSCLFNDKRYAHEVSSAVAARCCAVIVVWVVAGSGDPDNP